MKKVKVDMFKQEIMVFCGRKDIDKWLEKNPVEDGEEMAGQLSMCSGLAGVLFTEDGNGRWFIYLEEKDLSTLSHESVHVAYMMLEMVGVEHDANNHESFAYLQEFIFSETADKLKIPTKFE